jgi:hypothetical protein
MKLHTMHTIGATLLTVGGIMCLIGYRGKEDWHTMFLGFGMALAMFGVMFVVAGRE